MRTEICFCTAEHCALPGKSAVCDVSSEKEADAKLDSDCLGLEAFLKERRIEKDYGDLMLFHLVIGAMYLAKEEMTYEGENVSVVKSC